MIERADILPTGDELRSGIVLDTDSPMLMEKLLGLNANCAIRRWPVTGDTWEEIARRIRQCLLEAPDLILLIGGSGSGHLYSEILGRDHTHIGMEHILDHTCSTSLYGKNGHMWSRLVCGRAGRSLICNLPGPFEEAEAVMNALCSMLRQNVSDPKQLNHAMAEALIHQYGEAFSHTG